MTPSEFKSWFQGFTESMDGPPSLKQWERIQARVKEISGQPVTESHFVDRYWPSVRPLYGAPATPYWVSNGGNMLFGALNAGSCDGKVGNAAFCQPRPGDMRIERDGRIVRDEKVAGQPFDSHAAMNALGKADAASLAA